ncbi:hypothetical protein [Stenoxybacter acetivorans]|uniref:hypothetical protein n=1 Tax=Stenoxybacter acetivorans TaxID=422441 RepID=UPI00055EE396|nr:hypothetical protein [Stenoxybacter acetivorans]
MSTSIDIAFCIELNKNMDIEEAGMEYLALDADKRKKFHFYCADSECKQYDGTRTQLSSVNLEFVVFDYDSDTRKYSK